MNASRVDENFSRSWRAEILAQPPLIAPARQFQYPYQVPGEEDALARGALQVVVRPGKGGGFLATFALGFTDPRMPTGIWSCPDADELCAVAGGYAYVVDTLAPTQCDLLPLRPVVQVKPVSVHRLLLFIGLNEITAWGTTGLTWTTARLSWEGLRITDIGSNVIRGFGWDLFTDREVEFTVEIKTGSHSGGAYLPNGSR